jgi:hypothetical protein
MVVVQGSPFAPTPRILTLLQDINILISVHQNYVGADGDKVPFFLSVVLTDANNQCVPQYRAILWKKTVRTVL